MYPPTGSAQNNIAVPLAKLEERSGVAQSNCINLLTYTLYNIHHTLYISYTSSNRILLTHTIQLANIITMQDKVDLKNLPDLLTVREVADLLRVSPLTLKRWGKRGKLPAIRINSRGDRRYKKEQVQWLLGINPDQV